MDSFSELWKFFIENNEFISKFSTFKKYEVDLKKRMFTDLGRKSFDSYRLFQNLFTDKFPESEFEKGGLFAKTRKFLSNNNIQLPISKKEYDDYIQNINYGIDVKNAFIDIAGMGEDMFFTIPNRDAVVKNFGTAVSSIDLFFPGLFSYYGRKARCSINFNGHVSAIDIFVDGDYIHLESSKSYSTAFNEFRISLLSESQEVTISDLSEFSIINDSTIYVSYDNISSVSKFFEMFNNINISMNSLSLIYEIIKINKQREDSILKINGELSVSFLLRQILRASDIGNHSKRYNKIIELSKITSLLSLSEKKYIEGELSGNIEDDTLKTMLYVMYEDIGSTTEKIQEVFKKRKIFPSARTNFSGANIVMFNSNSNSVFNITLDKSAILHNLVPELGGINFIASHLDMLDGSNAMNSESIVVSNILYFLQEEYFRLDEYKGIRSDGIFNGDDFVRSIDGEPSSRVDSGYIYLDSNIKIRKQARKTTQKTALTSMMSVGDDIDGSLENSNTSLILLYSSMVLDAVSPIYTPNINFICSDDNEFELIKKSFFQKVFTYYRDLCGSADEIIEKSMTESTSPILINNPSLKIRKFASSPHRTKILKKKRHHEYLYTTEKLSQIFTYSDTKKEDYINIRISMSDMMMTKLYSGIDNQATSNILSFAFSNSEKAKSIANNIRSKFQKDISGSMLSNSSDMYFIFEQILPALVFNEMITLSSDYGSMLRQIIVNHYRYPALKESDISMMIKRRKKWLIKCETSLGVKVNILVVDAEDEESKMLPIKIKADDIISEISNHVSMLSSGTLKNYKIISSGKLLSTRDNKNSKLSFFLV